MHIHMHTHVHIKCVRLANWQDKVSTIRLVGEQTNCLEGYSSGWQTNPYTPGQILCNNLCRTKPSFRNTYVKQGHRLGVSVRSGWVGWLWVVWASLIAQRSFCAESGETSKQSQSRHNYAKRRKKETLVETLEIERFWVCRRSRCDSMLCPTFSGSHISAMCYYIYAVYVHHTKHLFVLHGVPLIK